MKTILKKIAKKIARFIIQRKIIKKITRSIIQRMTRALTLQIDALQTKIQPIDYESIRTLENYLAHNSDCFETELAIAAIMKDEGPYLREWIEYHKIVGVGKFYLYDHASADNTFEILKPYIENGEVIYQWVEEVEGQQKPQLAVYNDALQKYRNKSRYIAFIDIDEFLVSASKPKITDALSEIERKTPFAGLAVHWTCFGYNNHYTKPEGLIIENYTKNDRISIYIKSIVNPRAVVKFTDNVHIHVPQCFFNCRSINENGTLVDCAVRDHSITALNMLDLRINHYITKSYEEYTKRLERNKKGNPSAWHYNSISQLTFEPSTKPRVNFREYPDYEDHTILRFVPQVKEALRAGKS